MRIQKKKEEKKKKKKHTIKCIISYFLYFCHIQLCNDDCWVICILFSNVKFLFDHVTRRYAVTSLGAKSERQERQNLNVYMSRPRGPWFHNPSMCPSSQGDRKSA